MKYLIILLMIIPILSSCNHEDLRSKAIYYNNLANEIYMKNSAEDDSINKAVQYFDKAISLDSSYLLAQFNKLQLLKSSGRYQDAIEFINKIQPRFGREVDYIKGELMWKLKDTLGAKIIFLKYLKEYDTLNKSEYLYYYLLCYAYNYQTSMDSLNHFFKLKNFDSYKYDQLFSQLKNLELTKDD